jgi:hypothetical protein
LLKASTLPLFLIGSILREGYARFWNLDDKGLFRILVAANILSRVSSFKKLLEACSNPQLHLHKSIP